MTVSRLKICGIRSVAEARQLRDLQVDFVGLNFIPSSSRHITPDIAKSILEALRGSGSKVVGLFADSPLQIVSDYARSLKLDYIQLHGAEPPQYAQHLRTPVMRAIAIDPQRPVDDILRYIDTYPAQYFVLDRLHQGRGDLVDLLTARQIVSARPGKIFLAGGLTPDNLSAVLAEVQPYGIDIAGGVRTDSNNLDIAKVLACQHILQQLASRPPSA